MLGKLFYDNDEVMAQFAPLEGIISLKKKQKKGIDDQTINFENFEKKYHSKVSVLKGMMNKYGFESDDNAASNINTFKACQQSDSDIDATGPADKDYNKLHDNSAISANITADPLVSVSSGTRFPKVSKMRLYKRLQKKMAPSVNSRFNNIREIEIGLAKDSIEGFSEAKAVL